MKPILGYWNIRGLAAPIRYLLEQAKVEYDEKRYSCGPPPDYERSEYLNDKPKLGLDFPNLPYYIDDDVKLNQSQVILRYLGHKYNMAGANQKERLRAELLTNQLADYTNEYIVLVRNPKYEERGKVYSKEMPYKLNLLEKFAGSNRFAVGNQVTYADFVLFEYLEGQVHYNKDLLNDFPTLDQIRKRVLELEAIDKYFKSPRAIKLPFNGPVAYFGGPYSDLLQERLKRRD